jgi:glycosyltransferase involved in cell wall biosynthesis
MVLPVTIASARIPGTGCGTGATGGSAAQSAVAAGTIAVHRWRGTWQQEVDAFLALSEFGRQRFCEGGLPLQKVLVKPNSVADPGPRANPPSASREIVFVGRLTAEKGIEHLLAAWSQLDSKHQLTVIGTGPLADELRSSAPGRNVEFIGHHPHDAVMARLLRARALVFPSTWYEGHPLVAVEAAAAGLPVIHSDLGAMTELFAPDAEDLLFRPGDRAALAERLEWLTDDGFVDRYGAMTRRRFLERFTHDLALDRLEATYRHVTEA